MIPSVSTLIIVLSKLSQEGCSQGGKNTTARVPGGARIELRAPLKKYPGARQVPENLGQKSGDQGSCIWTWRPSQLS